MSYSMSARFSDSNELVVTYYSFDDDFDGNDFYRTLTFSPEETAKLAALLGVRGAQEFARVIEHRFGNNMYAKLFDEFCKGNDVHFRWVMREDYPGGIYKEGEE